MRRKKKMKRTRRRDIVNNIDDVMSFVWLKMIEGNTTYVNKL